MRAPQTSSVSSTDVIVAVPGGPVGVAPPVSVRVKTMSLGAALGAAASAKSWTPVMSCWPVKRSSVPLNWISVPPVAALNSRTAARLEFVSRPVPVNGRPTFSVTATRAGFVCGLRTRTTGAAVVIRGVTSGALGPTATSTTLIGPPPAVTRAHTTLPLAAESDGGARRAANGSRTSIVTTPTVLSCVKLKHPCASARATTPSPRSGWLSRSRARYSPSGAISTKRMSGAGDPSSKVNAPEILTVAGSAGTMHHWPAPALAAPHARVAKQQRAPPVAGPRHQLDPPAPGAGRSNVTGRGGAHGIRSVETNSSSTRR